VHAGDDQVANLNVPELCVLDNYPLDGDAPNRQSADRKRSDGQRSDGERTGSYGSD
jgi:hypothetical protein